MRLCLVWVLNEVFGLMSGERQKNESNIREKTYWGPYVEREFGFRDPKRIESKALFGLRFEGGFWGNEGREINR